MKSTEQFLSEHIKVLKEMRVFSFEPDKKLNAGLSKWYILKLYNSDNIHIKQTNAYYGTPIFKSKEDAAACVSAIGKERLRKYFFGLDRTVSDSLEDYPNEQKA